jgi:hypothetical protein
VDFWTGLGMNGGEGPVNPLEKGANGIYSFREPVRPRWPRRHRMDDT